MSDIKIKSAIQEYIRARKKVLALGESYKTKIGGNDNIIGRIGEFMALQFLESLGQTPTKVGSDNNPGYDFLDNNIKTQVKVITKENKRGRNVRLKKPWNQFLLIELNSDYAPERIGLITEAQHQQAIFDNPTWSKTPTVKLTMLGNKGLIGRYGKVYHRNELLL